MTWTPAPTPTPTATPTLTPGEVRITEIPGPYGLTTLYWSEDGQSVISFQRRFADETEKQKEMQWYRYDVATNASQPIGPAYLLDSLPWEQLEALDPGKISPSGEHLIYVRLSPEEAIHPTPKGPWPFYPLLEVWTARSDGTEAKKLYGPNRDCRMLSIVKWFAQETKVAFECSYETTSLVVMVDVSQDPVIEYCFSAGAEYVGMAASPDNAKLAFTGGAGIVQVCSEGDCQGQSVGLGYRPNWSADGRSLYYLKGDPDNSFSFVGVYKFDLDTETDTPLFLVSDYFPDSRPPIAYNFAVSPLDNMAVLQLYDSLWLLTWSP